VGRGVANPEPFVVRVYDVATGAEAGPVSFPGGGSEQAVFLAANADATRVLTLTAAIDRKTAAHDSPRNTATLRVWDVAAGRALLTVSLGSIRPGLALSPDGTRAAWSSAGVGDAGVNYGSYESPVFDAQLDSALRAGIEYFVGKFFDVALLRVLRQPTGEPA